ncbi:putative bifunctional diguanylate cyclase/phosphodiesterase [Simiduia aestuariiviva]|uniref:Diguanylate cyclase (GGDEF)-like protein n=1 Tax=Simiduia aestuariiviva TaxID=1510459 RepID=A0A839UR53_9GAMM|nr:GGDEF domain-containing phosphodiesterase [Simiduia aestuariiviva]MBB3167887.1 diguanylate cyclase (GGDEF)-like protein [Simiduia aestuariiviva]
MSVPSHRPAIDRQAFFAALESFQAQEALQTGILLIDLCNLGEINQQSGYVAGDAAIDTCMERLKAICKMPGTLFRTGSHHFAFILPGLSNPPLMSLAINKIKRQLAETVVVGRESITPEIHVGLAFGSSDSTNAYSLFRRAELSLMESRRGKPYRFDALDDQSDADEQHLLANAFRQALFSNEFELYYQPKLNLATGRVDQVEALLRWNLAGRGFIAPDQTVLLAEQLGESYNLTKWVVNTAVRQIKNWRPEWDLGVAVNIQAGLVGEPDLRHLVHDALAIWGLESKHLTLEITESAIIEDIHSGLENLQQLKDAGIALSIDDFGTGYSSLSYFKNIPASELKIDRCFVKDMLNNEQDRHIVKIVVDIAQLFGLTVVAEGVEDAETLKCLASLGCNYAQGYHIARPLPVAEFEQWIATQ